MAPSKVIRECDKLLNGELKLTREQMDRWLVIHIKKLATQMNARHIEISQLRNLIKNKS